MPLCCVQVSTQCGGGSRARCQTNFAGSMAASGSGYFYCAVAPTVICSNGAQKVAPNKPVCYHNIVAETLVLMPVCVCVCVCVRFFFFHGYKTRRRTKLSHVSTVTPCLHDKLGLRTTANWEGFFFFFYGGARRVCIQLSCKVLPHY